MKSTADPGGRFLSASLWHIHLPNITEGFQYASDYSNDTGMLLSPPKIAQLKRETVFKPVTKWTHEEFRYSLYIRSTSLEQLQLHI
jgi:hypothetical protein